MDNNDILISAVIPKSLKAEAKEANRFYKVSMSELIRAGMRSELKKLSGYKECR